VNYGMFHWKLDVLPDMLFKVKTLLEGFFKYSFYIEGGGG
jgi:hypothetical protein